MPIVADITKQCLAMAGLESLSDGPPDLEVRLISDHNRGINEIAELNPNVYFQERPDWSEVIRAPVTLNVQVTQASKEITIPSGYDADWMAGCAILISGDSELNRIRNELDDDSPSLEQPYMGATGTVQATVWHDWIRLPEEVDGVLGPVRVQERLLVRAQSLLGMQNRWFSDDYRRDYMPWWNAGPLIWQKPVDSPWQWYDVARYVQGDLVSGILIDALPPALTKIAFTAKVGITRVTSLQDQRDFITPLRKDHEVLLPMVRWYFSSYMMVSTPREQLLADYQRAQQTARTLGIVASPQKFYRYPKGC